ncbi:efflux RND transporter periplasmic adaptor subunit [Mucilaginibacter sp. UR6-11]|uniref:efflux RND transporter periplasmic adaptor subunit n=1 Tax=Mucilaginibacter sp. UR6-11 TaxID=1435644 RepID=UPI001E606386|nr:efflux RND transporter periplasmic adaptor subunit [Mucilaginibacter sp. UR6-11]MCC8426120.1 efflux RND transporter periplasmic adaptor subunit [Mucilaginibacter sp. UR6-11]
MKKLIYIPALLLLAACSHKPKDKAAELADLKKQQADINSKIAALQLADAGQDSSKSTDISVLKIAATNFTHYVDIQGKIDAKDNVTAYPQSPGVITKIYVAPGQHVNKGQLLVQLDNSVLKENIAQAESQAALAKTLFQRQKNLWDQKIGTEVQFLQAQTQMQSAQKQVDGLRQQADLYRIISPISGSIDQMDLKLGQVAQPGTTGIRIVNADVLKVKADVPESYAGRVNQGDNVKIVIPDGNDSLSARLTFAAKAIDPTSRSFAIEIALPARKTLRPNMTAIIKIADYNHSKAIVIPLNAIQKSEQGDYVYVNNNGIATRKNIKVGASYGSQAEITSGLAIGDQLITAGASDLNDGDKVNVLQSVN